MAASSGQPVHKTPLSGLPKDKDAAAALLHHLGYENVEVHGVEVDRIIAVVNERALTYRFEYDPTEEKVHIYEIDGWPL